MQAEIVKTKEEAEIEADTYEVWLARKTKHSVDDVRDHLFVRGNMTRKDAMSMCSQINIGRGDQLTQRATAYYRYVAEPSYGVVVKKDVSSIFEVAYCREDADTLAAKYLGVHRKHATGCEISIVKIDEESLRSEARVADTDMTYGEFMGHIVPDRWDDNNNGEYNENDEGANDTEGPCMCPHCRIRGNAPPPIENIDDSPEESSDEELPPLINFAGNPNANSEVWLRNDPPGGQGGPNERHVLGSLMNGIIELILQSNGIENIVNEYFEYMATRQNLNDLAARNQMPRGMLDYLVIAYFVRGLRQNVRM
jgi:hypothetical protein